MEVEIWSLAIVPMLAVVAVIDSFVHCSAWLSARLGIASELLAHTVILLIVLVAFLAWPFNTFDMNSAFAIKDYMRPMDHAFQIRMVPRLIKFDCLSILFSIGAALFISIKQKRNILLSIFAAALGSIGTIVWMTRRGKQT